MRFIWKESTTKVQRYRNRGSRSQPSYRRSFLRRLKFQFKVQNCLSAKTAQSNAVIAEENSYLQPGSRGITHHISINHLNAARLADRLTKREQKGGFGMGFFDPIDWNGDGKHDIFDDMLEFSIFNEVMKDDTDSDDEFDDDFDEEDW